MMKLYFYLLSFVLLTSACQDELTDSMGNPSNDEPVMNYHQRIIIQKSKKDEVKEGIHWSANQSIAIFKQYLFVFLEGWQQESPEVCIINRTNNQLLSKVTLPTSSLIQNHCNAAQFSNHYFSEDDEFPLLYLSSYYQGYLHILRITRNDENFKFEIIQEITTNNPSVIQYGNSYCIDEEHNKLYMYYNEKGNYLQVENNDLLIDEFDLPGMEEKHVVLTKDMITNSMRIPFVVFQGSCFSNGNLLLGVQGRDNFLADGSYVMLIDAMERDIKDIIKIRGGEPEGLAVCDHKLFLSIRKTRVQHDRETVFAVLELSPKEESLQN